ncbi:putative autophagy protein Apg16 [Myxozyma melibiosi]|uniref:Autophagy protein Apg16 n=1 Tax=Myxozyma melibiosi TaxID=54550 RepID=A0ABR1EY73_9ASCO
MSISNSNSNSNSDWRLAFAAALDERDAREKQSFDLFESFHRLALRATAAEADKPISSSLTSPEIDNLKSTNARLSQDTIRISTLRAERTTLDSKLRTRNEEFKERSRAIQMLQDEILTYQIQLNIAEENAAKLQNENRELVRRWMERVSREAEKLNDANAFLENLDRSVRHREAEKSEKSEKSEENPEEK